MAAIKKREKKNGEVVYDVLVSDGRGRRVKRTFTPQPTWSARTVKRELDKFAAELELELKKGTTHTRKEEQERKRQEQLEAAKLKTLRQYAEGVFMPAKSATFSENARSSYQNFLDNHIFPKLGDSLLTEITPAMITRFILDFQKRGYAHATTVKCYNILNGIFEMAFLDDSIRENPMLKVPRPKPRKDEQPKEEQDKAYTVEEMRHILECLQAEPLKWQVYIRLVADTGIRRGEACGLQWTDIDIERGSVTIRRNAQYTPQAGVYLTTPKNHKVRTVDIGAEVVSLLQQLKAEQEGARPSEFVFTRDNSSEVMHPQSPTRYFKKFGEKYGLKDFHPHKLRHTSASIALTNGADVVSVSQRLGHSDTSVTLRMYGHANEESMRRAGQTVRDAIEGKEVI